MVGVGEVYKSLYIAQFEKFFLQTHRTSCGVDKLEIDHHNSNNLLVISLLFVIRRLTQKVLNGTLIQKIRALEFYLRKGED